MASLNCGLLGTLVAAASVGGCIAQRSAPENAGRATVIDMALGDSRAPVTIDGGASPQATDGMNVARTDGSTAGDVGTLDADVGSADADSGSGSGVRCVSACSDVVDCLRSGCGDSPLANYAQCVEACTSGDLMLSDVDGLSCEQLEIWVCDGPFAAECGCRWATCERSCENVRGCLESICDEEVLSVDACVDYCEDNPEAFAAQGLDAVSCDIVETGLCPQFSDVCGGCPQRDPNVFTLGAACDRDADCQAGSLRPYCIPGADPQTGEETEWRGGYCSGIGCGRGGCGADGLCLAVSDDGQTACFALCGDGRPQCRAGYACVDVGGGAVNVCGP